MINQRGILHFTEIYALCIYDGFFINKTVDRREHKDQPERFMCFDEVRKIFGITFVVLFL